MPPVSSGLKKRVRAKLSILTKLQGVLATSRKERRPEEQLDDASPMETPVAWVESFESLLADDQGRKAFTDYLRKEYSQENMSFWKECCQYSDIADQSQRKQQAAKIYEKYLEEQAPEPINIDSIARKQVKSDLEHAPSDIFDAAKNQVYALMKTDSYRRFLRSEMSKRPLPPELLQPPNEDLEGYDSASRPTAADDRSSKGASNSIMQSKKSHHQKYSSSGFLTSSSSRSKLQGRPPCLGANLETNDLLKLLQSNTNHLATEESNRRAEEPLLIQTMPEILTMKLTDSEEDEMLNLAKTHKYLPKMIRSKSEHSRDQGVENPPGGHQISNSFLSDNFKISSHDHLYTSMTGHSPTALSSESESGDEDIKTSENPKNLYLLRRLSHSLDHMIELEQAGFHMPDSNAVRQLNDILEHEVLPSVEIERFLTTAETFTCHSTCNCNECQRLQAESSEGKTAESGSPVTEPRAGGHLAEISVVASGEMTDSVSDITNLSDVTCTDEAAIIINNNILPTDSLAIPISSHTINKAN